MDTSADAGHELIAPAVVAPALVGRSSEYARARAAIDASPALVMIDGEAGIGKTRLVTELAAETSAGESGTTRRVLTGRGQWIRESFPLGPVIEALRGRADDLAGADLSPVSGTLRPLLPELSDVLPPTPEPLHERAGERHRVFRGLAEVIGALAPLVVILEDLHWADEQTGDFIAYLLADPPSGVSLVLTYRDDAINPAMRAAIGNASSVSTGITLEPLDAEQTGALAASIMGVDRVSTEFATYLRERTSGLPFAIEELLALLRTRGTLIQRDGRWARRALDELDVPTRIRDSVLERVTRLEKSAAELVETAAVLQVRAPLRVLVGASEHDDERALHAVTAGVESGLLASDGNDSVGFRHPLAAQAVYEAMPVPRRTLLHARAAAALGGVTPVPLGQVAHHLRHAGQLEAWVDAAERAADQALALGHDPEAVRLLEDVLRHATTSPDVRGRMAVKLGESAIEAQRSDDVTDLLYAVLDEDLPTHTRGELRFRLGGILHDAGTDLPGAHRLFTDAIADLDHRPDLKAWAMVILGIPMAGDRDPAEHREWLQRALTVVPDIPDAVFQVFLLGKVAMVHIPTGDATWHGLADQIVQRTEGRPLQRREVNAFWSVGTQACFAGHHERAENLLTTGLKAVTGDGGTAAEMRLERSIRSAVALLRYCQGSWDGLADETATLIDDLAGNPRARIDAETTAACLALAHGDLDVAQRSLADVGDLVDDLGGVDLLPIPTAAHLRLAVARGEAEGALGLVDRLFRAVEPPGVLAPAARALPAVADALVTAGRTDEAETILARYTNSLANLDAPLAPAALDHAHGYVEWSRGRPERAAARFASAALLYDPLQSPYEAAQARENAALAMFESAPDESASPPSHDAGSGLSTDPRRVLLTALDTYRRLGAEWDVARATQIARRFNVPVPARHRGGRRGYGSALSPREHEVAELAALGRSNKEIASELYLSVNTVSRHITAAMRKLDIHSRAAIARRLAELGDTISPTATSGTPTSGAPIIVGTPGTKIGGNGS